MEPMELTPEQLKLERKLVRQRRILGLFWDNIGFIQLGLTLVGFVWVLLLPLPALWKETFVDEHALMPAGTTIYYSWDDVHRADAYLADIERLQAESADWEARARHLQHEFARAGLETGNTTKAVWARVAPPRSDGVEAMLLSANWLSRDGVPNVRGVAMLQSMGDFLRAQNHWAFDIYLVVGEGYLEGLENFMTTFDPRANFWTAVNIDYPYHSFSSVGVFYEGINGRLPNQDVMSVVSRTTRWNGGVDPGLHALPPNQPDSYMTGLKSLYQHFKYTALGRPSAAHGLLAKHRIDALTLYGIPAEGPHGFHTLGRVIEGTLRSFNNLLERLHASFFFYLLPAQDKFMPVGHYLPAAIILGASVTFGGFTCPDPLSGVMWALPAVALGILGWLLQTPLVAPLAFLIPPPKGDAQRSLRSLAHLFYGALIPTLAMVNFPQAILLAVTVIAALAPLPRNAKLALTLLNPAVLAFMGVDLKAEWEMFGNLTWPAIFAVWLPLAGISAMI